MQVQRSTRIYLQSSRRHSYCFRSQGPSLLRNDEFFIREQRPRLQCEFQILKPRRRELGPYQTASRGRFTADDLSSMISSYNNSDMPENPR